MSRNHARSSRKRAKSFVKQVGRKSDCEITRGMRDLYILRSIYKFSLFIYKYVIINLVLVLKHCLLC